MPKYIDDCIYLILPDKNPYWVTAQYVDGGFTVIANGDRYNQENIRVAYSIPYAAARADTATVLIPTTSKLSSDCDVMRAWNSDSDGYINTDEFVMYAKSKFMGMFTSEASLTTDDGRVFVLRIYDHTFVLVAVSGCIIPEKEKIK